MFNNINLHKLNVVSKFSFSNSQFFVGKTFFHHCSILNSSPGSRPINVSSSSTNIELSDFLFNRVGGSRFSELQVVPYSGFLGPNDGNTDLPIETISSYGESFPWFFDENGRSIDYTKKVSLFDGVKLISNYISKRKNIDQDLISETKLTELLKPFESNPDLTVLELFNHFSSLYDKDKEKIINVVKNFSLASTEGPADPTNVVLGAPTIGREVDPLVTLKPFGTLGDKTINEVAVFLRDLKWDVLLDKTQITLNAAPIAFNFVSFSLILRGYMKYVHNRPFEPGLPVALQTKLRNRQLFSFLIIGAPLVLFSIRKSGLLFKDMVTIQTSLSSPENLSVVSNTPFKISPSEGGLFVLISKFSKKIPNSLKTIFRLFLLGLVVIKLLGFNNIFEVFLNLYYLNIYLYVTSSLLILYELLNLYLVYKFSKKNINISPILPAFLINWLSEFKEISSTENGIQVFKQMCYRQIGLYISILVFIILIS